ncbi:hypothetical protein SIPHO067v1_p0027 [Vibrio phage 51E28.1]|nr:hypothetical protein SIPHO068v1_p0074 [Vibrio phage 51E28.4]QZI92867.1 hypothetical protein SIPHO067v1_p0027 [Vibrio phage 51E28.1]
MAKCTCFDNILEKSKERVKAHLEEKGIEIQGDVEVSWEGYSFFFSGDYSPVNAKIKVAYRPLKKDKTPQKNMKRDEMNILFDFCPYCGRPLGKSKKEGE